MFKDIILTQAEQYILFKAAKNGYTYIARDDNGELYVYPEKPEKEICSWNIPVTMGTFHISEIHWLADFSFIKWEDTEPYYITDLMSCKVRV